MGQIERTNTNISPLLQQAVIERDYTKGFIPPSDMTEKESTETGDPKPTSGSGENYSEPRSMGSPNFDKPEGEDKTRAFTFDEETDTDSDLKDGEAGPGLSMAAGSAKTFANFAGNAIQIYLPKLTYGYSKIDMEDVIINVEKGNLTTNWIDTFSHINKNTEEALAIPDESIKMWKSAFKDYLEYENITFANPKTAFIAATILLLSDQGVRAYQIRKSNEKYMKEAIAASNPGLFSKESNEKENSANEVKRKPSNEKKDEPIAA